MNGGEVNSREANDGEANGGEANGGKEKNGPPKSRKSARSLTVKKMAEGQQRRMEEEEVAKKRRKRKAPKVEARILTQEELLEEAKETEKKNLELLEEMLKLELKQKPVIRKQKVVSGPAVSFLSNHKGNFLTFTQVELPAVLDQKPTPFF